MTPLKPAKKFLGDVVAIRLLLILLLVLYHAFCIFCGAWDAPDGYPRIAGYWWVARAAYSFMLEAFVFLSGYLLGMQRDDKGLSAVSFRHCILKKGKRLLLPAVCFGVVYYALFYDLSRPLLAILYSILNGTGHLWFLPMLFWCFVGIYLIEKMHLHPALTLALLTVAALFGALPLPFRLGNATYYLLFFFAGYCIRRHRLPVERFFTTRTTLVCSLLYLTLFILLTIFNTTGGGNSLDESLLQKVVRVAWGRFSSLSIAACGVGMVYFGANLLLQRGRLRIGAGMARLSTLCFGVYIYQQFILKIIYYKLDAIALLSPLLLPWVGFIATLLLSLLLAHLTLKTRAGRYLIG